MKIREFLRCEMANLLCWFRVMVGLALMLVRPHWGWAVLTSLAFVSDAVDGWCYRRVSEWQRPNHWFNRLPISMDPIADFFLTGGGIVYLATVKQEGFSALGAFAFALIAWQIVARMGSKIIFTVMMTALTYLWFLLTVAAVVRIWQISTDFWIVGVSITLVAFYACYFAFREKGRLIRRPRDISSEDI